MTKSAATLLYGPLLVFFTLLTHRSLSQNLPRRNKAWCPGSWCRARVDIAAPPWPPAPRLAAPRTPGGSGGGWRRWPPARPAGRATTASLVPSRCYSLATSDMQHCVQSVQCTQYLCRPQCAQKHSNILISQIAQA